MSAAVEKKTAVLMREIRDLEQKADLATDRAKEKLTTAEVVARLVNEAAELRTQAQAKQREIAQLRSTRQLRLL